MTNIVKISSLLLASLFSFNAIALSSDVDVVLADTTRVTLSGTLNNSNTLIALEPVYLAHNRADIHIYLKVADSGDVTVPISVSIVDMLSTVRGEPKKLALTSIRPGLDESSALVAIEDVSLINGLPSLGFEVSTNNSTVTGIIKITYRVTAVRVRD